MPPTWDGKAYAKYRPSYPPYLYDTILVEFRGEDDHAALVGVGVDVGCASGQVTRDLSKRKGFSKVIGIDTSESQLAEALSHAPENVEYRLGTAESTGLPSHYADLITAAAALHWFDIAIFFKEAHRILKPNGVVAAWSYNAPPVFPGDGAAAAARAYNRIKETLDPFFDAKLQRALQLGYSMHLETARTEFKTVELKNLSMEWEVSCDILAGFVKSWSPYTAFVEKKGEAVAEEHIEKFKSELKTAVGVENYSDLIVVTLPLELLLAKDPI
jgi:SAM-dependent methyltransferase